jgi:16S rRNA processing protein RimM
MEVDRVTIARVLKPVGLRGELKAEPLSDVPGRFEELVSKPVFLSNEDGDSWSFTVDGVRARNGFVYLSFREITTLEEASRFIKAELQVDRSEVPVLPEGYYYHFDLIGLSVILEGKGRLGKLEEVFQTGSNDVFVVRDGELEYLIPAIRSVVLKIDLIAREMLVRSMEGMLA